MKEEELLLSKEEVADIKEGRNVYRMIGTFLIIFGFIISILSSQADTGDLGFTWISLVIFIVSGIVLYVMSYFKYKRDYRDKLKELKKGTK